MAPLNSPIRYASWNFIFLTWGAFVLTDQIGTSEDPGWLRKVFGQPDGRW